MSEYNIQMNKYNALNAGYDQLYPVTKIEDVDGLDTALQNKAPAGYGYGDAMFDARAYQDTDGSVFESILETLLQELPVYTSRQVRFFSHPAYSGAEGVGTLSKPTYDDSLAVFYGTCANGSSFQKCKIDLVWTPLEWVNPPMQLGVEYRTTERYKGKPVYTMAVDFGALPVDTYKIVGHNIANVDCMLSACGVIPEMGTQIPGKSVLNGFWKNDTDVLADRTNIQVVTRNCNDHLKNDGWTAQITLRYTKTTD